MGGADHAARDDWTGYGGVGDYRLSNGNTKDVMDAAHAIRDRGFETLPRDTIGVDRHRFEYQR